MKCVLFRQLLVPDLLSCSFHSLTYLHRNTDMQICSYLDLKCKLWLCMTKCCRASSAWKSLASWVSAWALQCGSIYWKCSKPVCTRNNLALLNVWNSWQLFQKGWMNFFCTDVAVQTWISARLSTCGHLCCPAVTLGDRGDGSMWQAASETHRGRGGSVPL